MPTWHNVKSEWLLKGDGELKETRHDTVTIEPRESGTTIEVTYVHRGITYTWSGREVDRGHFVLDVTPGPGRCVLHCLPDRNVLEGWYTHDGEMGAWRLTLTEP